MSKVGHIPVRWSWLKAFALSPAHALHAAQYGKEPTAAMKMGTRTHAAAFEPHRIKVFEAGLYVPSKSKTGELKPHTNIRRGDAFDQWRAKQPSDAVVCNAKELAKALAMAEALRRADNERVHPVTGEPLPLLFGPGVLHERNIRWSRNGRACSSTPDARLPGRWIADLKQARSGSPARYPRDATWQGYPSQLVMYDEADASERTGDYRERSCELYSVVIESVEPYVVTTYRLDATAVSSGERTLHAWWEQLNMCEASDHWPGYAQSVVEFSVDDPLASLDSLVDTTDTEPSNDDAAESDGDAIDWDAD